jgi:hypothetical protein
VHVLPPAPVHMFPLVGCAVGQVEHLHLVVAARAVQVQVVSAVAPV